MNIADYRQHDGLGLADLIRRRAVSPREVVMAAIQAIEAENPRLNAVVHAAFDEALAQAEGAAPAGPFAGVPFLIKDLGPHVAGMPRSSGSRYLAGERGPEGELVRRYRAAGLVILGKTNTPELGITGVTESGLLGPCRNPWNPDHVSGGSSGGAAAATASGMVPLAHASDGMGSIRIPAACCGLVGLKTTRARNPDSHEDFGRATGLSVDHVVTRSVRDTAAMLDATGAPEADSPFAHPPKARPFLDEVGAPTGRLRIAFSDATPSGAPVEPEIADALRATARLLEDLGHHVEEGAPDVPWRRLYRAHGAFSAAAMAAAFEERLANGARPPGPDDLEPLTWAILERGRGISGAEAMRGWATMRVLARRVLAFHETVDVWMTPVMGTAPPRVGHIDPVRLEPKIVNERQAKAFPFTPPANFTGQPAISLPMALSADGLPIGIQFAGRYGDEATLIRLASQIESARPWRRAFDVRAA